MRLNQSQKKNLGELARLVGATVSEEKSSVIFTGITSHSRKVMHGDLFIAAQGATGHGADYASAAIAAGAVAVVTDSAGSRQLAGLSVPVMEVSSLSEMAGEIASWFYGRPASRMRTMGITGTNGKTTTASLLSQLLKFQNRSVSVIGTLGAELGGEILETGFTTPEADQLQRFFALALERRSTDLVMEVSSHALSLGRVIGTQFAMVGFTNLTQDHLDFHGDLESYFQAKKKLFASEYSDLGFVNIDDAFGLRLVEESDIDIQTLSKSNPHAHWHYTKIESELTGYNIAIRGTGGILIEGSLHLFGAHNLDNALMAVAIAVENGLDPLAVGQDLSQLRAAPGRLELVQPSAPFTALVDYAHTPDAVEHVLAAMRERTIGRVIAVLGCGGDRDSSKRPIMGDALIAGSDIAIMTSDNPRSEDPSAILRQMAGSHTESDSLFIEADRRKAIALAVAMAEKGDCILILGKGHETGQLIEGVKHPFDDRLELSRAIEVLA